MSIPVFIVGAGFSLAANGRYESSDKQFAKRYPLASDLGVECFGSSWNPAGDVEAAFAAAVRMGNRKPIENLVKLIQAADYYLGSVEAGDPDSVYGRLLQEFPGAQFVSFNYDSLLEQVLLRRKLWNPRDGFGVPVEIGDSHQAAAESADSRVQVVHLHGSVLLYAVEFSWQQKEPSDHILWMTQRDKPKFLFDPHNLGHCFSPFSRALPSLGYRSPEQRVIVPVHDKSEALREEYVRIVFTRACELVRASEQVIAVGYRFAECDRSSFEPLLRIVRTNQTPLWIVTPDARDIANRLGKLYPRLQVLPIPATFEQWAGTNFYQPQSAPSVAR